VRAAATRRSDPLSKCSQISPPEAPRRAERAARYQHGEIRNSRPADAAAATLNIAEKADREIMCRIFTPEFLRCKFTSR